MDFTKTVRLGTRKTCGGRAFSIYCAIKLQNGRLSITGVEGPLASGNCVGGCGQIDMHLRGEQTDIRLAPGWTRDKLHRFFEVWERWHLNHMKAGSPAQEAWLRDHKAESETHRLDHYRWACSVLADAGLNPDPNYLHNATPYSYGSAWLTSEIPTDVIDFLRSLPDTDRQPAWV